MSVIYLAGPIDYGTNDSDDRQEFIAEIGDRAIVYDATTTFVAPNVTHMTTKDMGGAIAIHHSAIEVCDLFVADMRKRSVGIPIEMWIAHEMQKPIFVLYATDLPASIYIDYVADAFVYSWSDMAQLVERELSSLPA
jgi:hypothetical protein